jgi:hypothetical protein
MKRLAITHFPVTAFAVDCQKAKNASRHLDQACGDVRAGFKKGHGEMKEGFKNDSQWVSDKIAP